MQATEFLDILGADFFVGVPDSQLRALCDALMERYGNHAPHIIAANEGTAAGIAAGHYLATGRSPLVYLQNSGEGNIVIISLNEAGVIEPMIMPMYFQPVGTELRLVDLPQQMRKAWFDENSRDENGTLRELALDDAFWDQFNRDYDAWYAEHPLPGAPGRPQP